MHTAGITDAGVISTLRPEQVARVFAPKVTAVRHLDKLTRELVPELAAFVVFSSVSSVFLGAGTGSYAAANAFLDAVAQRRRAEGLPATSLAWGLWDQATGDMAAGMDDLTRSRMNRRGGVPPHVPRRGHGPLRRGPAHRRGTARPGQTGPARQLRTDAGAGRAIPPLLRGLIRHRQADRAGRGRRQRRRPRGPAGRAGRGGAGGAAAGPGADARGDRPRPRRPRGDQARHGVP
ncbi:KR domain-containing protein [Streptomyces tricolor]|nr:KR domain-containing protein [Streptomyces tricolor]